MTGHNEMFVTGTTLLIPTPACLGPIRPWVTTARWVPRSYFEVRPDHG